ncbi:LysE family translocator [Kiloniella laminariae]|uniref:LysE family translocator n=1 Tax=Kiloniella laminariae TaxID=454162 RepID=UPI00036C8373|nr:LysE family translocator [Kiloniella laminariae]
MSDYLIFAMAFAVAAASPGPDIAALLAKALSEGMVVSLRLAFGMVLGKLVLLSAALLGLVAIVEILGPFFIALKIIGGGYLVWLGVKTWRNSGKELSASIAVVKGRWLGGDIVLGVVMSLSNPMAIVFYLAVLPGLLDIASIEILDYLMLCGIVFVVMSVVALIYGGAAAGMRRVFTSGDSKRRIDRTSGGMMVMAGMLVASR